MSKKKPATKKTAKGAVVAKKASARKAAGRPRGPARVLVATNNRTAAATIFVYKTGAGLRVRTSPQILAAGPGFIEWTIVNLASDDPVDVDITWPEGGPWGNQPIPIRGGNARISCDGAKDGRYKYNVTVGGFTEDPEVIFPEY